MVYIAKSPKEDKNYLFLGILKIQLPDSATSYGTCKISSGSVPLPCLRYA